MAWCAAVETVLWGDVCTGRIRVMLLFAKKTGEYLICPRIFHLVVIGRWLYAYYVLSLLECSGFRRVVRQGRRGEIGPRCGISCWTVVVPRKSGTLGHVEICQCDQDQASHDDFKSEDTATTVQCEVQERQAVPLMMGHLKRWNLGEIASDQFISSHLTAMNRVELSGCQKGEATGSLTHILAGALPFRNRLPWMSVRIAKRLPVKCR